MIARLRAWFLPLHFEDVELDLRSRMLHASLIATIIAAVAVTILTYFANGFWPVGLAMLAIMLGVFAIMKAGRIRTASILFVGIATVLLTVPSLYSGGVHGPILILSAITVIVAGILLGTRWAVGTMIFNMLALTAFAMLEVAGLLPETTADLTPFRYWVTFMATFGLSAFLIHLLMNNITNALRRAQQSEQETSQRNKELLDLSTSLEVRVSERTTALERRAIQLRAAAEVGRAAASIRDLDELLKRSTQLISERFGFYHAGIFLLDSKNEYAVLRAANSPGGQRMLERGHKLQVGTTGIVGYVAKTRQPRIALDVGRDAAFFNNPDLPQTRSEMALPLEVGDQLLGVLDVQSQQASAFSEEDVASLQVLADQIAIAIENGRLFRESQEAAETARKAYDELSHRSWDQYLRSRVIPGYRATPDATQAVQDAWDAALADAREFGELVIDENSLALPITIRNRPAGAMRLRKANDRPWSPQEIAWLEDVLQQISQALESAHLFSETQRRAIRERMAADITARIRTSNDPQTILQTAITELKQAIGASRAQVTLRPARETGGLVQQETPAPDETAEGESA